MPEDSGWYWCVADGYQSGLFVQVISNTPDTATTPAPAVTMNTTPQATVSTPGYPMLVPQAQCNADQLSIYQTYDSRWSDHQVPQLNLQLEKLGKS